MMTDTFAQAPVIIVGGGLSGLCAAAILASAGYAVTLFEKASAPGGRSITRQHGRFSFNLGAHAFYLGGMSEKILGELGVQYSGSLPAKETYLAFEGGRLHSLPINVASLFGTTLLKFSAKGQLAHFYTTLKHAKLADLHEVSLQDWLERQVRHPSVRQFILAGARLATYTNAPNMLSAGLLSLLAEDIVSYSDGGGKVSVARNPIYGADRVARFLLGMLRKAPEGYSFRVGRVNGQSGIINYVNGMPYLIVTLEIVDGRVREIDIVANPDKLRGIPALN